MESEKVKEIKKALEQNDDNGIMYEVNDQKRTCKFIHHKDILTLINELESENERWQKDCADIANDYQEMGKFYLEETEKNQQLKDRIAELEKEKNCVWEEWTDGDHSIWCCSNCKEDFCFMEGDVYENNYGYCPHCGAKITALKELKEDDLDETLKEFLK